MIPQMDVATGQSAQIFRAMNMRRFNAPPDALADYRVNDVDTLVQPFVEDRQAEQERLQQERLDRMRQEVNQGTGSDSDLADRMATLHIPPSPPPTI